MPLGSQLTRDHDSVPAVSLRRQHVPVAVLPDPDQVLGHGEHPVWSHPSGLPQADREDHEEGVRGQSGAARQAALIKRWRRGRPGLGPPVTANWGLRVCCAVDTYYFLDLVW